MKGELIFSKSGKANIILKSSKCAQCGEELMTDDDAKKHKIKHAVKKTLDKHKDKIVALVSGGKRENGKG